MAAMSVEAVRTAPNATPWTELNSDKTKTALVNTCDSEWIESPAAGVARKMIERLGDEVARCTTVVRFLPNKSFPEHTHGGGEEFFVLEGTWEDDFGSFPKFWYIRNYIGSKHTPHIPAEGCTIMVKLRQMAVEEWEPPHTSWDCSPAAPGWKRLADGRMRMYVYASRFERVLVERWDAGSTFELLCPAGGREIFVVDGSFSDEVGEHKAWSWSRYAEDGTSVKAQAGPAGCYLYIKEGHGESPEVSVKPQKL